MITQTLKFRTGLALAARFRDFRLQNAHMIADRDYKISKMPDLAHNVIIDRPK